MKPRLTEKQKKMAYVLNKDMDFGYSMEKIGKLMDETSQSTISRAIKEVEYERRIYNLEQELDEAKKAISKFNQEQIQVLTDGKQQPIFIIEPRNEQDE